MAYGGQMPKLWKLRDLQTEGGASPGDLLVEFSIITFATATTATVNTVFADGNIVAMQMTKLSGGTGTLTCPFSTAGAVSSGALTITNSVTTSTDVVSVMVVGRLQV